MPHNPQDPSGYTLVPTWVSQSSDIDLDEYMLLVGICHQRQARQSRTLEQLTGWTPRKVHAVLSKLVSRNLVVQQGLVYDVPARRAR
jgi:hypothetical protein